MTYRMMKKGKNALQCMSNAYIHSTGFCVSADVDDIVDDDDDDILLLSKSLLLLLVLDVPLDKY